MEGIGDMNGISSDQSIDESALDDILNKLSRQIEYFESNVSVTQVDSNAELRAIKEQHARLRKQTEIELCELELQLENHMALSKEYYDKEMNMIPRKLPDDELNELTKKYQDEIEFIEQQLLELSKHKRSDGVKKLKFEKMQQEEELMQLREELALQKTLSEEQINKLKQELEKVKQKSRSEITELVKKLAEQNKYCQQLEEIARDLTNVIENSEEPSEAETEDNMSTIQKDLQTNALFYKDKMAKLKVTIEDELKEINKEFRNQSRKIKRKMVASSKSQKKIGIPSFSYGHIPKSPPKHVSSKQFEPFIPVPQPQSQPQPQPQPQPQLAPPTEQMYNNNNNNVDLNFDYELLDTITEYSEDIITTTATTDLEDFEDQIEYKYEQQHILQTINNNNNNDGDNEEEEEEEEENQLVIDTSINEQQQDQPLKPATSLLISDEASITIDLINITYFQEFQEIEEGETEREKKIVEDKEELKKIEKALENKLKNKVDENEANTSEDPSKLKKKTLQKNKFTKS